MYMRVDAGIKSFEIFVFRVLICEFVILIFKLHFCHLKTEISCLNEYEQSECMSTIFSFPKRDGEWSSENLALDHEYVQYEVYSNTVLIPIIPSHSIKLCLASSSGE